MRPGFDPTHPASRGIAGRHGLSVVAASGGLVSLVTGTAGTNSAGFPNGAIKAFGPTLRLPSSVADAYTFPGTFIADAAGTLAAIYTVDSAADGGNIVVTDNFGNGGFGLRNTQLVLPFVIGVAHGFTMLANTPMFLAASKGPSVINFVMADLTTGKVVRSTVADTNTPAAIGGGLAGVGGQPGAGSITGNIAAAMWAPVHLSMPQLLRWAQDPWAFWYPRSTIVARSGIGGISGTLAANESVDLAAMAGAVTAAVSGTLAANESVDLAAIAGEIAGIPSGTLFADEMPDRAIMSAAFVLSRRDRMPYASSQDYTWESGRPLERPKKWT